ncbi:MAG: 4-hydroxy-tetrahydrodipicolinate reductase, partial [Arcobacteraceae bacterium]|nr:4-hydroxy-tetrahydrodipicolinate reductase [Arcobacteraceae bacterium]
MLKVGILGSTGRVGSLLIDDLANDEMACVGAVHVFDELTKILPKETVVTNDMKTMIDSSDIIIDFSAPKATEELLSTIIKEKSATPLVIATTGFSEHQKNLLIEASKIAPILYATNMSLGVAVLNKLVHLASKALADFDCEIIEQHHRHKVDSPSGTALTLAEHAADARELDLDKVRISGRDGIIGARTKDEIAVMSLRGGDIVGRHTAGFYNDGEFIELNHTATSRNTF